ncbi:MAG: hypothetical protein WAJ93_24840 [Candidatus Nitrosopolaris sp.]
MEHLLACQPNGFAKPQPFLDTSLVSTCAIMVNNAFNPDTSHFALWAIRANAILDGRFITAGRKN